MKISPIIACYRDAQPSRSCTSAWSRRSPRSTSTTRSSSSTTASLTTRARCSPSSPRATRRSSSINHARTSARRARSRAACGSPPATRCVLLDGDLQDPPELIEEFVERWREGYDVVYGERVHARRRRSCASCTRPSIGCSSAARTSRAARRRRLLAHRPPRGRRAERLPETHRFMRGLRAWVGFKQIGVPVRAARADVRHHDEQLARNLGWARARSSRSPTCRWT